MFHVKHLPEQMFHVKHRPGAPSRAITKGERMYYAIDQRGHTVRGWGGADDVLRALSQAGVGPRVARKRLESVQRYGRSAWIIPGGRRRAYIDLRRDLPGQ